MKPQYDDTRVTETADFILEELRIIFDRRDIDAFMNRRLQACPAYKDGLTNGERLAATLRALSLVQLDVIRDLNSLTIKSDPSVESEDEAA